MEKSAKLYPLPIRIAANIIAVFVIAPPIIIVIGLLKLTQITFDALSGEYDT